MGLEAEKPFVPAPSHSSPCFLLQGNLEQVRSKYLLLPLFFTFFVAAIYLHFFFFLVSSSSKQESVDLLKEFGDI